MSIESLNFDFHQYQYSLILMKSELKFDISCCDKLWTTVVNKPICVTTRFEKNVIILSPRDIFVLIQQYIDNELDECVTINFPRKCNNNGTIQFSINFQTVSGGMYNCELLLLQTYTVPVIQHDHLSKCLKVNS